MVFVYIFIALIPITFYILLFLFCTIERPKTHSVTPICYIPTCVRCSKNVSVSCNLVFIYESRIFQIISNAVNHLKNVPNDFEGYSRIKQALDKAQGNSEVLLFEMVQLECKPVWKLNELGYDIADDVRKLEEGFTTIKLASLKVRFDCRFWFDEALF